MPSLIATLGLNMSQFTAGLDSAQVIAKKHGEGIASVPPTVRGAHPAIVRLDDEQSERHDAEHCQHQRDEKDDVVAARQLP